MNLGFGEILLILIGILIVFGASRLPELGRALGTSMKEFKKAVKEDDTETKKTSRKAKKKKKK